MSRTVPTDFTEYGPAKLTPKRLEMINDNYKFFLADSDKADDPLDHEYYIGNVDAYSDVLTMLHQPIPNDKDGKQNHVAQYAVIAAAVGTVVYVFRKPIKNFVDNTVFKFKEWRFGRRPVK